MTSSLHIDRLIADLARMHHGLVPHGVLLQAGVERSAITRRLDHGTLVPVLRGVSAVRCDAVSAVQWAIAAALMNPDVIVSHRAAAALWKAPITDDRVVAEVSVVGQRRLRFEALTCHRSQVDFATGDRRWMHGVRVSSPTRNVIELASVLMIDELELILDHYVHERLSTVERVGAALDRWHRGSRGLPGLARLIDDRLNGAGIVRSWLEQGARRVLRRAGLPEPVRNYEIRVNGRKRVLDLAWPDVCVGVEADSWKYHSKPADWGRTRTRDRALLAAGWHIVPCVVADTRSPAEFVEALRATMRLAAKRVVTLVG